MSHAERSDGERRSANVVPLFPEIDPVYDKATRLLVTTYLASGVAAPGGHSTELRSRMPLSLIQAYGLCGPHAVSRAPVNINVHDTMDYARLIKNPYIVRVNHIVVAAYFNSLPLTTDIIRGIVHSYIDDAPQEGIDIGINEGWYTSRIETGWPDEMYGMPISKTDQHIRPTRIGIYRVIEAITFIMNCAERVRATLEADDTSINYSILRERWPHETQAVDGVIANSEWEKLGKEMP